MQEKDIIVSDKFNFFKKKEKSAELTYKDRYANIFFSMGITPLFFIYAFMIFGFVSPSEVQEILTKLSPQFYLIGLMMVSGTSVMDFFSFMFKAYNKENTFEQSLKKSALFLTVNFLTFIGLAKAFWPTVLKLL